MNQSILFPYTSDTHLEICRSALLTLQSNKGQIIEGLNRNRNVQFDIVLYHDDLGACFKFEPDEPLCDMLLDSFIAETDKEEIFRNWEHFSGDVVFVVEGNQAAYRTSWYAKSLWLNPKRWLLVEYLIDCINKELDR